jgi:diketogulonate reductase-like aldo/keto reductase
MGYKMCTPGVQNGQKGYCTPKWGTYGSPGPLSNVKRENERDEDVSALYNPVIQEIAKSKHKTTAQIILRWHLQNSLVVIPKTVTPERLIENSELFDFALSDHEMYQIDQLGHTNRRRMVNPPFRPPNNKPIFDD